VAVGFANPSTALLSSINLVLYSLLKRPHLAKPVRKTQFAGLGAEHSGPVAFMISLGAALSARQFIGEAGNEFAG